ncbi:hypothetical protein HMPREF9123_0277 [Neisseria bacilliformis ATCC BAA-1200]|uniref:Uncharacterized protein n=1 Tax=Neisseria bacilliformis ATCC BAA-1200 TaxID=888742 RepID=F2B932_9NEIS|nr:hypothetical protein HMPREF9123_0277 [Neisseria bacilliformis ATCC BAA-1200]
MSTDPGCRLKSFYAAGLRRKVPQDSRLCGGIKCLRRSGGTGGAPCLDCGFVEAAFSDDLRYIGGRLKMCPKRFQASSQRYSAFCGSTWRQKRHSPTAMSSI